MKPLNTKTTEAANPRLIPNPSVPVEAKTANSGAAAAAGDPPPVIGVEADDVVGVGVGVWVGVSCHWA
jgi:hypothetical protein